MKRQLNIQYLLGQVFYFAAFSAMFGFASIFLLHHDFSNSLIGITFAISSIISVFLQPTIASFTEKNKKYTINQVIRGMLIVTIIFAILLYLFPINQTLIMVLTILTFSIASSIMPLVNSLAFIYEKYGYPVNYGIARGLGSVSYAVTAMAMGYFVSKFSPGLLPLTYIVFFTLVYVMVTLYKVPKDKQILIEGYQDQQKDEVKQLSILGFIKKYNRFMIFLVGFVFVYFAHMVINNFFIQVITAVGGGSKEMGTAVFLAAIVELPTMAYFTKLNQKFNNALIIKVSVIMFFLKHLLTYLASSVMMIYVASFLQIGAYALFIPASVYYVNQRIDHQDTLKGQSLLATSMTAAGVFASLVGGILIDEIGVSSVLLIAAILSAVGVAIVFMAIEKVDAVA